MLDGHLGKCKECTKLYIKENTDKKLKDPSYLEKEKGRQREKYYRLNYKEKHKAPLEKRNEYHNRYKSKYPEKRRATSATSEMKRHSKDIELHHWSYNDIHHKDIVELSKKDHYKAHRFLVYDKEKMMYMTSKGELLDSKIKHEQYLKIIICQAATPHTDLKTPE